MPSKVIRPTRRVADGLALSAKRRVKIVSNTTQHNTTQHKYYLDWLATLQENIANEEPETIFERFWEILEPTSNEEMYYALAACEVIAAVLGKQGTYLDSVISKWANAVADRFDHQLARNAYNFVAPMASSESKISEYASDLKARLR